MRIEVLNPHLAERYEAFLMARSESLLYQSWRYQSLLLDLLGCRQQSLIVLNSHDNVLAALPLMAMELAL
jgi:hypothetical protein